MTSHLPDDEARRFLAESARVLAATKAEALDDGDYQQYLDLHGSHERLAAFVDIAGDLSGGDYWRLLADVWVGTDVVFTDLDLWRELFADERPGGENLMTDVERSCLAALAESVEVFRGFGNPGGEDGIAWTLDPERALFFAQRFPHSARMRWLGVPATGAWVAAATVPRERIVALFDERQEREVIVVDLADIDVGITAYKPLPED